MSKTKKKNPTQSVKLNPNNLLNVMQRLLIEKPKGWFNVCVRLNNNLISYLRDEDNPQIDWESFPIARSWFTQNVLTLKEIES